MWPGNAGAWKRDLLGRGTHSREQEPGRSREIPRNSQGLLGTGFKVVGGLGATYFPEIHTKRGVKLNNFSMCNLIKVIKYPLFTVIKRTIRKKYC